MTEETDRGLIGKQLGAYQITALLGAGGMGEVYRAEDTRLGRTVAVKVLPAALARDQDRLHRFVREARTASVLSHANVAHIYDIGQSGEYHFIAMEYVEGQSLAQRRKAQPLELGEILDIGIQVADALAEAHEKGITHRDIKSANLMITPKGRVKVLDFGLAKITRPESRAQDVTTSLHTTEGRVMGTVGYMSPEQVLGKDLDTRTDLFSLGVVLYEMTTGRLPFSGNQANEMMDRILHAQPEAMARFNYEVPAELERIIRKCLEKDRERRYQLAREVRADLSRLREEWATRRVESAGKGAAEGGSGTRREGEITTEREHGTAIDWRELAFGIKRHKLGVVLSLVLLTASVAATVYFSSFAGRGQAIDSLAVLPFVNVSANPDTEYLSDGITDSLINSLAQLPRLKVMSRNSVFRYKGKETDAQQAGATLGVRAVLTGKVTQHSNDLIVSAELVDVRDNSHLWGEQYNRKLAELAAVQADLSRDIAEGLRLKLSGEDKLRLTKRGTENAEAYELYLKGRYSINALTKDGSEQGLAYFQQAIEKDPSYGAPYAGLALYYAGATYVASTSSITPKEAYAKAKAAALKAVELDDSLAEAHMALGMIAVFQEWDWKNAEREFKRAIALNPSSAMAHHEYSHYWIYLGRFDESLAESQRALALDPLSVAMNYHLGFYYYYTRQYEQASAQIQKTLEMNRNHAEAHQILGSVYEQKGRYQEALAELERARELGGADNRGLIGHVYAISGQRDEARILLHQLLEEAKHKYASPYYIARIYEGLGEKDQAFAWLEKAYAERDSNLINIKVDPRVDTLRSDARFADLLRRIGLAL